jgi:hypothetical protein
VLCFVRSAREQKIQFRTQMLIRCPSCARGEKNIKGLGPRDGAPARRERLRAVQHVLPQPTSHPQALRRPGALPALAGVLRVPAPAAAAAAAAETTSSAAEK